MSAPEKPPVVSREEWCSCQFSEAWRCARARNLSGQITCHCSCHRPGPAPVSAEEKPMPMDHESEAAHDEHITCGHWHDDCARCLERRMGRRDKPMEQHPEARALFEAEDTNACPRCRHAWALHPPCAEKSPDGGPCKRDTCHGHDGSDGRCDCREEKPMDTPMTPAELVEAIFNPLGTSAKAVELVAQRDALLLAEKNARIASLETKWSESDTAKAILDSLDRQTAAEEHAKAQVKRLQDELDRAENKVELFRPRLAVLEEENARLRSALVEIAETTEDIPEANCQIANQMAVEALRRLAAHGGSVPCCPKCGRPAEDPEFEPGGGTSGAYGG